MKTPPLLLAAGLVFWGAASGQWLVAVLLAAGIEGLRLRRPAVALDAADFNRVADLCSVLSAAAVVYFLATQGLPKGLSSAVGWFPATLAPLVLAQIAGGRSFRVRNLFFSLRNSRRADADDEIDVLPLYFAVLPLAAGVLAPPSAWFFPALAGLAGAWLFATRRAGQAALPFLVALAVAGVSGFMLGEGIHRLHGIVEAWVIDNFIGNDNDPYQSQTRIGDLGRVKQSERIVWRIEAKPAPALPLLIRNGVFTHFNGKTWIARHDAFRLLPDTNGRRALAADAAAPVAARVRHLRMSGTADDGRALLALPLGSISIDGRLGQAAINGPGVVKLDDAPDFLRFDLAYEPSAAVTDAPSADTLFLTDRDRRLLARVQQRSELAGLADKPARERLVAVEAFFAQNFRYTLFLGDDASGGKDLERFLLTERSGHCEYFASATVLLLRALGIPARYVTGYSVQEYSRLERAFVVRHRHAHAWAEAFVDGRWIAVDTTPSTWVAAEEAQAPPWRPLADVAAWAWAAFSAWRADGPPLPGWLAWALGGVVLAIAGRLVWRRRVPRVMPEAAAVRALDAYGEFEADLAARGFPRGPGETPRAWLARLRDEGCAALDAATDADELVAAHYRQRYATDR